MMINNGSSFFSSSSFFLLVVVIVLYSIRVYTILGTASSPNITASIITM
jgi:hypothetical protein